MRRVVITGIGVISPLGTKEEFWKNILNGKSGIDFVKSFDPKVLGHERLIAGEAQFEPTEFFNEKEIKRMDRFSQFALAASRMAVRDSNLDIEKIDKFRSGVILGTAIGPMQSYEQDAIRFLQEHKKASAYSLTRGIPAVTSGMIAMDFHFKGANFMISAACASGGQSIGISKQMIESDHADIMITGGVEACIRPGVYWAHEVHKAMCLTGDRPQAQSRPFDKNRHGFVLGEGAGILILESYEHAMKRGANIYAELTGFGFADDAYHVVAPDPEGSGATQSMISALEDAHTNVEEIGYINAHGTSTPYNDKCETKAIKRAFGSNAYNIPISSTKSMIGHTQGAAGGLEAITTILSLEKNILPPTINYEVPDEECDLNYIPNFGIEKKINHAISNSFGFGGNNTTLVFKQI
ncbi:beta-ketoacyl-ACP synthase II [Candidatus Margulisiibacteriota bacterium]